MLEYGVKYLNRDSQRALRPYPPTYEAPFLERAGRLPLLGLWSVCTPRISIGPAGYRINREAGLPRRVTPIGGPGTRFSTCMQAPRHSCHVMWACKEVGRGGWGATGGTVPCRGGRGSGTEGCVFAWCLSEDTSVVSGETHIYSVLPEDSNPANPKMSSLGLFY